MVREFANTVHEAVIGESFRSNKPVIKPIALGKMAEVVGGATHRNSPRRRV